MNELRGKIAVITGGSSGIGLAAAHAVVAAGGYVYITGRRQPQLDRARALVGTNVTAVRGDVTRLSDIDRLFDTVRREKGVVDVVVTCAGFAEGRSMDAATPEHFDKTFDINTRGAFFTVQKALPLMARGGAVVLVSSIIRMKGVAAHATYAASKAALRSFARTFAVELTDRNIRVNSLSPGWVDTPMIDAQYATKQAADSARTRAARSVPLGRIGRPGEMAAAIIFLASDASSFCTGIDLIADGGVSQL